MELECGPRLGWEFDLCASRWKKGHSMAEEVAQETKVGKPRAWIVNL